jgi:ABC-type cobalamin/Fe3+-siderophores transport system ATPase subunit
VLVARHVSRHHGAQVVLHDVSVSITAGARLGVVGPNGIGKSTLLRVLAGLEAPDGGTIERTPATTTVGWLPQEPDARPGERLADYLARRTGVAAASAELDAATAALGDDDASIATYSDALERFLALGGDDLEARTGVVLDQVGLPADRVGVDVAHLSGGQAARAALAAVLLSRHDVLLLDEPTNDLDFAGLDLLEGFVASTAAAVVAVGDLHPGPFARRRRAEHVAPGEVEGDAVGADDDAGAVAGPDVGGEHRALGDRLAAGDDRGRGRVRQRQARGSRGHRDEPASDASSHGPRPSLGLAPMGRPTAADASHPVSVVLGRWRRARAQSWRPHSVLSRPTQRPDRGSFGSVGRWVQGWQPIDRYPCACSGWTGTSWSAM